MGKHVCTVVYILSRAQSACLQNLGATLGSGSRSHAQWTRALSYYTTIDSQDGLLELGRDSWPRFFSLVQKGSGFKSALNDNISGRRESVLDWKTCLLFNDKKRCWEQFSKFFFFCPHLSDHACRRGKKIKIDKIVSLPDNGPSLRRVFLSLVNAERWGFVGWSRCGCLIRWYILRSSGA